MGVDDVLASARDGVPRLTPVEAHAAQRRGALLVDTRTPEQREKQGQVPGSVVVDRTVLEWRLDPCSPHRIREAASHDLLVVVLCREGYSSSLAAASLRAVGLHRATDVVGGVEAWLECGLPVHFGPGDVRR
ncbi:rhodanese-like domain-containing protein [Thalassiella azotivora]